MRVSISTSLGLNLPMLDFRVLVLEGAYPTSVAITLDMLSAAAAIAPRLRIAPPSWKVCSPTGGMVPLQGGLQVMTARLPKALPADKATWVVPGLGVDRADWLGARLALADAMQAADLLRRHAARGGAVAASCSAVFLLQAAGVLAGKQVTTSWWLAPLLQQMAPDAQVNANRMVCADGPVVTAGAAFAQTDLMRHLLMAHGGNALTDALSRTLLIDGRQAQAPYMVPEAMASGDALVGRLTARIDGALPTVPSIAQLAAEYGMAERTLARHVARATGRSPLALVHSIKLRRARSLLENSRLTVEQVAEAVGYQDATALRRMMRKVAGANPSQFRARGCAT